MHAPRFVSGALMAGLLFGSVAALVAGASAAIPRLIEFESATTTVRESERVAKIVVRRSGPATGVAVVRYAVQPGTATRKADYSARDGLLVFLPGERERTIRVFIRRDQEPEGLETVQLLLLEARGARIGSGSNATLQIIDDAPWIAAFTPASGVPGDAVSIQGLNFTGVTSVTFNGAEAPFTVVNPEQIRTSVPAGASTGPILITTPIGMATSPTPFVVPQPVTLLVTTTNDSGPGSLRQAILDSNAHAVAGANCIHFAIGAGLQTIYLQSLLPAITRPVVIDGTTQPAFSGAPIVEINGSNGVNPYVDAHESKLFDVRAPNCTIRGLVINNLGYGVAIALSGGHGVVEGNYIGPSAQGTRATQITGIGVVVYSERNRIGGTTPAARNVLSAAIEMREMLPFSRSSRSNIIQGNFIGTDATGTQVLENIPYGIFANGTDGNQIGGAEPGAGNVISGSFNTGLWLTGVGNVVQGNFIGTDVTGTKALPNGQGIFVQIATNNLIGGLGAGEGNLISGNRSFGIYCGAYAEENVIQGNWIGTDVTGLTALSNRVDGIVSGPKNVFLGNRIFGNGGLGINIVTRIPDGVTLNDVGDNDGVQNFPTLDDAISADGVTTIVGRLQSRPNESFTLEFFSSVQPDPSGYGEGQFPLGTLVVATDATGMGTFVFVGAADTVGQYATATARSAAGNTSEFSRARQIVP